MSEAVLPMIFITKTIVMEGDIEKNNWKMKILTQDLHIFYVTIPESVKEFTHCRLQKRFI